jgi:hypothetical protein
MAYNTAISKTLSSCNFNIPQPNKLLVFMHTIFSLHACSGSQTTSEMCILTIKFICSKRKYHSLQFGSTGNWSSLWAYNTAISKTLFFLQFQHSSAKQIVSFHALYIFKTMHTNSPSHFHLFKGTKKKEISLFTYASFQHTKFSKCNSNIK